MAPPIVSSLAFLLLLLINGHGINGRDVKVELPEQKQVDQPYITGYKTTALHADREGPYGAGYKAAHTFTEHSHPSQYKNSKQEHELYITQYGDKRVSKPYVTQYGNTKRDSKAFHQDGKENGHGISGRDLKVELPEPEQVDRPYIASYPATAVHADKGYSYAATYMKDSKVPKQYAGYNALYKVSVHDPDLSQEIPKQERGARNKMGYEASYKKRSGYSYAATYMKDSKVPKQYAGYNALYKVSVHDPDLSQEIPKQERGARNKMGYEASYKKRSGYSYAATYRKESENSNVATYQKTGQQRSSKVDHTEAFKTGFFALDDLYVGNVMNLQFPVEEFPHFLSRKEAESIPFSKSQLPSVLQLFSISEDSPQGEALRGTLEQCEAATLTGETKLCATSLESMLEFVRTIIGPEANLNILTTSFPTTSSDTLQNYTISKVSQDVYAPKWVACHPMPYPYAVYFCHFIGTGSRVFKVSLRGEKGDIMEALGICHLDTSEWNPDHILFQQLGFKPGEAPVCHFFPVKHLLWVPLAPTATM